MATRKRPAIQFYTGDWLKSPDVSKCSPATRGIWVDCLCYMHEAGMSWESTGTKSQLMRLTRSNPVELDLALDELVENNIAAIAIEANEIRIVDIRHRYIRKRYDIKGSKWLNLRKEIIQEQGTVCAYCGCDCKNNVTIDHVIPASKGGTNEKSNLVVACRSCNSRKGNRHG